MRLQWVQRVDDKRMIEIETKLAHQEHLLGELNTVLTSQQSQLTRLEDLCESLIGRIRSMSDSEVASDSAAERPPHY